MDLGGFGNVEDEDDVCFCSLSYGSIEGSNGTSVHDLNQPGRSGASQDWTEYMKSIGEGKINILSL
jgi:hypothetical protein